MTCSPALIVLQKGVGCPCIRPLKSKSLFISWLFIFSLECGHVILFSSQTISSDSNAETLSARYEPHVCLTRDALFRLLNNHGPDFGEQWEVPVWVKLNPGKGKSSQSCPLISCISITRKVHEIMKEDNLYTYRKMFFIFNYPSEIKFKVENMITSFCIAPKWPHGDTGDFLKPLVRR